MTVGHSPDHLLAPMRQDGGYEPKITRVRLRLVDAFLDTLANNPLLGAGAIALVLMIVFSIVKKLMKLMIVTGVVFVALMAWAVLTGNDPGDPIRAIGDDIEKSEKPRD